MSGRKIKSIKRLVKITRGLQKKGKIIIFTNGCFDILHYGHVKYLEEAKKRGDLLIVAINSDNSIRKIKGNSRPIVKVGDRAKIIAALESVDFVVIFDEDTPLKLIKLLKPDILVKGSDWRKNKIVGADFLRSYGGKVIRAKLLNNRSTTAIIEKIKKLHTK